MSLIMAFTFSDLPGSASLVDSLGTRCDDLIPSSLFYYAVYFSNVNYVKGLTCRFPSGNLTGSLFSLQSTFSASNPARVEIPTRRLVPTPERGNEVVRVGLA